MSELELTRKSESQTYPNAIRGLKEEPGVEVSAKLLVFEDSKYHLSESTVTHLFVTTGCLWLAKLAVRKKNWTYNC